MWTKLGEWSYSIALFIFEHVPLITIILAFLNGLVVGTGTLIPAAVNTGFIFPSPELSYALVIPWLIGLAVRLSVFLKFGPPF